MVENSWKDLNKNLPKLENMARVINEWYNWYQKYSESTDLPEELKSIRMDINSAVDFSKQGLISNSKSNSIYTQMNEDLDKFKAVAEGFKTKSMQLSIANKAMDLALETQMIDKQYENAQISPQDAYVKQVGIVYSLQNLMKEYNTNPSQNANLSEIIWNAGNCTNKNIKN